MIIIQMCNKIKIYCFTVDFKVSVRERIFIFNREYLFNYTILKVFTQRNFSLTLVGVYITICETTYAYIP